MDRAKRKRVLATKPPAPTSDEHVKILFSELIIGSLDKFVDLESCIPFTRIRPLSTSGVHRLVSSFLGTTSSSADNESHYQSTGVALGSNLAMVVGLEGSLFPFVREHFKQQGLTGNALNEKVKSRPNWYGIVDGLHSHAAFSEIVKKHEKWRNFKWYVKCLNCGFTLDKYRQLARVQNARQHPSFYIELTLYDVLYNLRTEHDRLKRENKRCGGAETAQAYDGARHARNSTLQQKANISIRLPLKVLQEMGSIMNQERPDIVLSRRSSKNGSTKTENDAMKQNDCRVYRKFISISTLKGSSVFMNASGVCSNEIQMHCLHRVKDMYSTNSFKAITSEDLTREFKYCSLAFAESKKFLKFIEDTNWPTEMQDLRINLLRTTVFNSELEENSNNGNTILPKLLDSYRRYFPELSCIKEAKWKQLVELEASSSKTSHTVPSNISEENANAPNNTQPEQSEDITMAPPSEEPTLAVDENLHLSARGIFCYQMKWKEYLTDKRTDTSERFDLLLTSPPGAPSRSFIRKSRAASTGDDIEKDEMIGLCNFMKRTLKSGAYVVLIIDFTMYKEWYDVFDSNGLKVYGEQYIISYDPNTIKRVKIGEFGQSAHDVAIVAKMPGSHPDDFQPNFDTKFNYINTPYSRRHSIITNVPATRSYLTKPKSKVPLDHREFHPFLFHELIDLFSPDGGSVIDPYGKTFTTPLACIRANRKCHSMEWQSDRFQAAITRLHSFVAPQITHADNLENNYSKNFEAGFNDGYVIPEMTIDDETSRQPEAITKEHLSDDCSISNNIGSCPQHAFEGCRSFSSPKTEAQRQEKPF